MKNKKSITALILIIALVLLSTFTYAKPYTAALQGGLIEVNNFFANEQYKPYAKTIDFFFFALLFIAIYMMGARYAFKEVKRPEQVIVILLGLMTAFLLVLGGFSATILLPYLQWLFYILLFILYWWLLKGIKNKFWRFILALLLTLLTIALLQGLFGALAPPELGGVETGIGTFFKSLGDSFKGIDFGGIQPGVPSWLQDLYGQPGAPTGPATLPSTTTPGVITTPTPKREGWLPGGYSAWWLSLLILLGLGGWKYGKKGWEWWKGRRRPTETTIQQIIAKIEEIKTKKTNAITAINQKKEQKHKILQAADQKIAILAKLKDPAFLWEGVKDIEEGHPFKQLYNVEKELTSELKKLKVIEVEFFNKLDSWQQVNQNITQDVNELKTLIGHKTIIKDIKNMGIAWLIVICYDFEKREAVLTKELNDLLEDVDELVKGKFEEVRSDEGKLGHYNDIENLIIIKILIPKIESQINKLNELKRKISEPEPQQAQATEEVLRGLQVKITRDKPTHAGHYTKGTPIPLEAQVFTHENTPFTVGPNMILTWDLSQTITDATGTRDISMRLYTGLTGNPTAPTEFVSGHQINLTATLRDASTGGYISASGTQIYIDEPGQPPTQPRAPTPINVEFKGYDGLNIFAKINDAQNKYGSYLLTVFARVKGTRKLKKLEGKEGAIKPNAEFKLPIYDVLDIDNSYDIVLRAIPIVKGKIVKREGYNTTSTIEFKPIIKVEIKEPAPTSPFYIGDKVHPLKAEVTGPQDIKNIIDIISNEQESYSCKWFVGQKNKIPAPIHTGRETDFSSKVVPAYFDADEATLKVIITTRANTRLAEHEITIFLKKKGETPQTPPESAERTRGTDVINNPPDAKFKIGQLVYARKHTGELLSAQPLKIREIIKVNDSIFYGFEGLSDSERAREDFVERATQSIEIRDLVKVGFEILRRIAPEGGGSPLARLPQLNEWLSSSYPDIRVEPLKMLTQEIWLLIILTSDGKIGIAIPTLDSVVGPGEIMGWYEGGLYDGTQSLRFNNIKSYAKAEFKEERRWECTIKGVIFMPYPRDKSEENELIALWKGSSLNEFKTKVEKLGYEFNIYTKHKITKIGEQEKWDLTFRDENIWIVYKDNLYYLLPAYNFLAAQYLPLFYINIPKNKPITDIKRLAIVYLDHTTGEYKCPKDSEAEGGILETSPTNPRQQLAERVNRLVQEEGLSNKESDELSTTLGGFPGKHRNLEK